MQTHAIETRRRVPAAAVVAGWVAAGTVVIWAANAFGLWWVTALVGVALGLALHGTLRLFAIASVAALLGWGLPLLWLALGAPIGAAAATVALIMGFGRTGAIVLVLTLLFGWLLVLAGAWLGASVRRAIVRPTQ